MVKKGQKLWRRRIQTYGNKRIYDTAILPPGRTEGPMHCANIIILISTISRINSWRNSISMSAAGMRTAVFYGSQSLAETVRKR